MSLRGMPLSADERKILTLLATHHSTSSVAGGLALDYWAVQRPLRTAAAKLGARSNAEAVAIARDRGEIDS